MSNTIQINIKVNNDNIKDELIARLSVLQYDAFEEKENELNAYINQAFFDTEALNAIMNDYKANFTQFIIKDQNWNALWESSFEPVTVDDFCVIRADFHKSDPGVKHEIIITPKMSFGTGHHATTYLMVSEMRNIDFTNKQVTDFGTGTAVLAVLAEKLGSKYIWAIDNDDWSIENAKENIEKNGCQNIEIEKTNGFIAKQKFDVILANINKNVILENAAKLMAGLYDKGQLLLSGLLKSDEEEIVSAFTQKGLKHISTKEKNNWICILMNLLELSK